MDKNGTLNRDKHMKATESLCLILLIIFLLDTFLLVPKGVKIFSVAHLIDGDKTGFLTQNLKLITSKVMHGQIWRPLTSMFLHAGLIHIIFNLMSLANLGAVLEHMIGDRKFLLLFVLSGLFSAVCMMLLTGIEDGLGASTGIFGLFGVLLVMLMRNSRAVLAEIRPLNWILFAVMVIAGNATDNITRLEHLTGTIGGVLLGLLMF